MKERRPACWLQRRAHFRGAARRPAHSHGLMQNEDAAAMVLACAMAGRTAQAGLSAAVQPQPPIELQRLEGRPAGCSIAPT